MIYYNPLDKFYKSQTGAICADSLTTFRVKGNFDSVSFCLKKDGEEETSLYPMLRVDDFFELNISLSSGLYFYCFKVAEDKYIGLTNEFLGEITNTPIYFQLTAYSKDYKVPSWFYGGVIYQIFPDRFYSSYKKTLFENDKVLHKNWDDLPVYQPNEHGKILNNDFFGGDLKGIEQKLPYIKSLGVNVIYLNPIFTAHSNHRYDTGDYMSIDYLLGTIADLKSLIKKAYEMGVKIVLDGVFNHTGDDSIYFNKYGKYGEIGAYQSKESKYYSWYNFLDFPNKYDSWWGIETLPAVNETNPDFINFITGKGGVIDFYTSLGLGGWRLDVVDELPTEFVEKIRESAKSANPESVIIGEVWEDVSNKISYGVRRKYFQGAELDSAMNYPLKNAIIDFVKSRNVKVLKSVIKEQIDHYPHQSLHAMMNILSTHDTMRLLTVFGGEPIESMTKKQMAEYKIPKEKLKSAKLMLKIASLLQFTLCGVPCIYYGDEIGMEGYADPLNRCTYPWGAEDKELLSWYRFLGELRDKFSAFKTGDFNEIYGRDGVFVYSRSDENSEVLIAVNLDSENFSLEFDGELYELIENKNYSNYFSLRAYSYGIFIKKKKTDEIR